MISRIKFILFKILRKSKYLIINFIQTISGQPRLSKSSYNKISYWNNYYQCGLVNIKNRGFDLATKDKLIRYKKSDTLFILGSGPSINNFTPEQWNYIGNKDSIGFNFFFIHSFVPTFFHMELMDDNKDILRECYQKFGEKYLNVPFMINYNHLPSDYNYSSLDFINNLYITLPKRYTGANPKELEQIISYHYNSKNFIHENFLFHYRASIMIMLSFGLLLGYKNIVLAGVDLTGNDHFYYSDTYNGNSMAMRVKTWHMNKMKKSSIKVNEKIHLTADPSIYKDHMPIDEVILLYYRNVFKKLKLNLFITSKNSLLYSKIPLYRFP